MKDYVQLYPTEHCYPDSLDFDRVCRNLPDLGEFGFMLAGQKYNFKGRGLDKCFQEWRAVFEWLRDRRAECWRRGKHEWYDSYGLKHVAERAIGAYVANGVFIAAAYELGIKMRRYRDKANPNAQFKLPYLERQPGESA